MRAVYNIFKTIYIQMSQYFTSAFPKQVTRETNIRRITVNA